MGRKITCENFAHTDEVKESFQVSNFYLGEWKLDQEIQNQQHNNQMCQAQKVI